MVVSLGAMAIGQFLLNLAPPSGAILFIVVSVLVSIFLVRSIIGLNYSILDKRHCCFWQRVDLAALLINIFGLSSKSGNHNEVVLFGLLSPNALFHSANSSNRGFELCPFRSTNFFETVVPEVRRKARDRQIALPV